jgi:hypothetical protein
LLGVRSLNDLGNFFLRFGTAVPAPDCTLIPASKYSASAGCALLNKVSSKPVEANKEEIMKKALIAITTLALLGAASPRAHAHGNGWAVAGGVLAGVGTGILISQALEPHPVYVAPAPVYVNPAPVVVQQPATVVYQPAPAQQVVVQQPIAQPVYVQSAPVVAPAPVVYAAPVVYPAPVYVRPGPPVIGIHVGFGPYYHHHRHY